MFTENDREKVGYRRPPAKNRFSSTNQPERRRRAEVKGSTKVLEALFGALAQTISVKKKGKSKKVAVGEALAQQLVAKTLSGTAADQLKLLTFVKKSGLMDLQEFRDELEENYQERLQKNQEEYSEVMALLDYSTQTVKEILAELKRLASAASDANANCSCGACDDVEEALHRVSELCCEDGDSDAASPLDDCQEWSPGRSCRKAGDGQESSQPDRPLEDGGINGPLKSGTTSFDDDPDDPFYSGMIA